MMGEKAEKVIAFPDTNIFLHYPPIDQIDWCDYLSAREVELVLCMQVIHELDEKKSHPDLGSRASRAIQDIRRFLNTDAVRYGVTLSIFNYEIRRDDFPDTLSIDSKDHRIVHTVRKYKEEKQTSACVVSEDLGMELRCKVGGIDHMELPKGIRLESPKSEEGRKIAALTNEIQSLKASSPKIVVTIAPTEEVAREARAPMKIMFTRHMEGSSFLRDELDRELEPRRLLQLNMLNIPEYEIERYIEELEVYASEYKKYLLECIDCEYSTHRSFSFGVEVANVGGSPAEEVDVYLTFPKTFSQLEEGKDNLNPKPSPKPPNPPKRPEPPTRAVSSLIHSSLRDLTRIDQSSGLVGGPAYEYPGFPRLPYFNSDSWSDIEIGSDFHTINLFHKKIKHGYSAWFGPFFATLSSWEAVRPIQVKVTIHGENIPNSIEMNVPIIFKVEEVGQ